MVRSAEPRPPFTRPRPPYSAVVIKDEPLTRVERVATAEGSVVRKVYRSRPFLLWRTFLQVARARREYHNLERIAAAGVPCVRPVSWRQVRALGCVVESEIATVFEPDALSMKQVLAETGGLPSSERRALIVGTGQLLRTLHGAGYLSCRFTPRNVLVLGTAPPRRLLLCDLPYAFHFRRSILGRRIAGFDVFDIAFSAPRQRDFSAAERMRLLLAYTDGDRAAVRLLWRRLSRRNRRRHRLLKEWLTGLENHVRLPWRLLRERRGPEPHAQSSPMSAAKLDHYASTQGAAAYKRDHERKLHRRLSTRREHRIFARFLRDQTANQLVLDLPAGHGRLFPLLRGPNARVIEADWSGSMLTLNRRDHEGDAHGYLRCCALDIPLPDRAVDVAVSVRLSHHFDREADRERHLRELFRVAADRVLVSYFSFHSLKNLLRRLRAPLDGKRRKNTLRSARVREIAADCGFVPLRATPLSRLASGHVFASFRRATGAGLLLRSYSGSSRSDSSARGTVA